MIERHEVKSPFMIRKGQFSDGQDLAFGIAENSLLLAIEKKEDYRVKVGNRIYSGDPKELLEYSKSKRSIWKNKQDQMVAIVPLFKLKEML